MSDTRVSERTHAANTTITRDNNLGFRAVRRVPYPNAPTEGTHSATNVQIVWNWNAVTLATGYKWNTTNNYATATDMGTATTKTETGLITATSYTRYVWAYNTWGNSISVALTQSTSFTCATDSLTIDHQTSDGVAPVNKSTKYATALNISGETSKCWITKNLGADIQADSVNAKMETKAGWYWQFNRKQGYKHDGTTVTPSWTITNINENSDWQTANDPCAIELGTGWRIPTKTEWENLIASGSWTNWDGPWNSALKLHTAGFLSYNNGSSSQRGSYGSYWSSAQSTPTTIGWRFGFGSGNCAMYDNLKASGFSVRCLKDYLPVVTTTAVTSITGTTASTGGNVTAAGMSAVTARGVCYGTSSGPTIAGSKTTDGTGTGTYTSSLSNLSGNTTYYVRAYATNAQGTVYGNELNFTTLFACGGSLTINHLVSNGVAPVDKSTTYGTVTNIPGETSKCWITKNLGATLQADSVNAKMETKAGWSWQFNHKQGYKHDGTTLTPSWTITSIDETSDWVTANDPCAIELGTGWRLPTKTEWENVDALSGGNWTNWYGPWNSSLKLHAAGFLNNGSLNLRGSYGTYWSSTQVTSSTGWDLLFSSGVSNIGSYNKVYGFSVRCLRD
jgi:uncharacterized protein (TIGR02145 family)